MRSFAEEVFSRSKNNKNPNNIIADIGLDTLRRKIKKGISKITGSGLTLTNNEIKDIMNVIKSSENRGNFLKGTRRKINSQEGELFNSLAPAMRAGLSLKQNVLTPLAKSIRSNSKSVSYRCIYSKDNLEIKHDSINIFK